MIKIGDIVTVQLDNLNASNTFLVKHIDTKSALLYHPLFPSILIEKPINEINKVSANLKDSTERSLDFVKKNIGYLDYNSSADLDALCLYFVVKRKLTPKQKRSLSNMAGRIAAIIFNDDIKAAMDFIRKNEGVLDQFNQMWYRNFKSLFSGKQPISSAKQRDSLFNMAGFTLAELETPTVQK